MAESLPPVAAAEELALEGEAAAGTPPVTEGIPGRERGDKVRRALAYIAMFGIAVLFAIPFLWSLSTSFRPLSETVSGFSLLPHTWTTRLRPSRDRRDHAHHRVPRVHRRLRVRALEIPGP